MNSIFKILLTIFILTLINITLDPISVMAFTYPHGRYTSDTETCGQCHSLHNGNGYRLLRGTTTENTCLLCHDGSQSNYNVRKGVFFNGSEEVDSPARGIDPSFGYTSNHLVGQRNVIPGGSPTIFSLACTSCHNPHGTNNHRNLQKTVNGTPNIDVTAFIAGPGRSTTTSSGKEVISYQSGIINFCTACHLDYKNYNSSETYGDIERWRHRVDVPLTGGLSVTFPEPGLYTTLPTNGPPTGANITNLTTDAGLLNGTYNYLITAYNQMGESTRGNIKQVETSNNSVTIIWDSIINAVGYRIYRAPGSGDPNNIPLANYRLLAEVGDNTTSYTDTGSDSPGVDTPPSTSSAKIICLTCHFAHGTKTNDVQTGYTYLRRIDNMGICQNCHKK